MLGRALHEQHEHLTLPGREAAREARLLAGGKDRGGGAGIERGFTAGGSLDGIDEVLGVHILEQVAAGASLEGAEDARAVRE